MTKKELVLNTALQLFAQQGYDATATLAIAKEAGVSEGLLFRHFGNKEGLLKAIIVEGLKHVAGTLKPLSDLKEGDNAIAIHLKLTAEALRQNQQFWKLVHTLRLNEKTKQLMSADTEKANAFITNILQNYFKKIGRKNPKTEAQLYFAAVDGIALHYLENPAKYPLIEVFNQLKTHYND